MTQAIPQDPPLMPNGRFSTSWQRYFIGLNTSGAGTVTSVSIVPANGISGSVGTATTTPAITLALGNITPTQVASTGAVTGTNLSGTNTGDETTATIKTKLGIVTLSGSNTGDQTITLTGDVTGSGTGSFAATVGKIGGQSVSLAGPLSLAGSLTTSGAFASTFTMTGVTTVTFPTTGTLATLAGTEVLSSKTLTAPTINGGTASSLTGFSLRNAGVGSFDVTMAYNGTLGGARTLTWDLNNTNTTISLGGNVTIPLAFTITGSLSTVTFNIAGTTNLTLPNSGTVLVAGGALGTPSSGVLTSCTGLPIASGVSGLAAGVATFLATPSSANLIAAVTDETGTGALVFGTSPTIGNPVITGNEYLQQGAPTSLGVGATLTAAQMLGGIIQYTGAAAALTLPTGTLMDAGVIASLPVDRAFEVCFVNTGSGAVTLTAGVSFTIVGSVTVTNGTSGRLRCRKTAANTYVAYRVA